MPYIRIPAPRLISRFSTKGFLTHRVFLVMLLLLFFQPVLAGFQLGQMLYPVVMSAALIGGVLTVFDRNRYRIAGIMIAVIALAARWLEHLSPGGAETLVISEVSAALFFAYTAFGIFSQILRTKEVSGDTLAAAISLYLLVGFVFALIYASINTIYPGSFSFTNDPNSLADFRDTRTFFYFSFVTLTTVGFGDALPLTDLARAITMLEAIFGQMFIAIIVGSLISKKRAD